MRRRLPALLTALLLGLSCAYAVACGEDETGLLSAGRAEGLKANLDDLDRHVEAKRCQEAAAEIQNLTEQVGRLPASTDEALRQRLEDGIENLSQIAPQECRDTPTTTQTTPTETTPTTPTETTPTTPTETTPTTPTETTPTTPTETTPTTPTETTPTPPPTPTPTTEQPQPPTGGDEAPGAGFVPPGQAKKQGE